MDYELLEESYNALIAKWSDLKPTAALILGSGWSEAIEDFKVLDSVNFAELKVYPKTNIEGHKGRLSRVEVEGKEVIIFEGRKHFYEGYGWTPVAFPIYLLKRLGVEKLLLTNASGGIGPDLKPGDLMLIKDHINFLGDSPLKGAHNEIWGPRFPDMTFVYSDKLRALLKTTANEQGLSLKEGVYAATMGPAYETPAEVKLLDQMGANAVGMSTVPEAMLARAAGLKVAGLSCITNFAAGISEQALSHAEVQEIANRTMPQIKKLLSSFLKRLVV